MKKKLKLTKLTIANLNQVKGGRPACPCEYTIGNGAYNLDHNVKTLWLTQCIDCVTHDYFCG